MRKWITEIQSTLARGWRSRQMNSKMHSPFVVRTNEQSKTILITIWKARYQGSKHTWLVWAKTWMLTESIKLKWKPW